MKAFWISLAVLVAIIQPLRALQLADAGSRPVTVEVDSISLSDIASDSVTLSVRSHVTSLRKLRIKRIRFEQMRMGTLPVYLDPIEEKLSLEANTPVDLPAIPVKIYFRDLDSLGPIQHAVSDGQATIDGNARVDLDLNLLERFATNEWNAHADMPISLSVPVDVPGGMLGRAAALVTLGGAQVALDVGGRILNPLRQSLAGEDELRRRYAPALVVAESRYTLIRNQQRVTVAVRQLGFRISADQFVLTGEMLEPWTYDTDVAMALKTGNASLADTDRELLVWPVGTPMDANSSRSLSTGGIQVLHAPRETESTEVPTADGHVKVRISRRDSNSNYAVLRFTRPEDQGTPVALGADSKAHPRDWNQLAMFKVSDQGRLDVVVTPADRDGDRIHLQNALDNSAFGSVLISEDGVAGMLQDERSGMTLRNKW